MTKLIRLTGLMLLLLLTSCSSSSDSSDVVPQPDNGNGNPIEQPQYPIGFTGVFADSEGGTASASATRGVGDGEFTNTELQASGFGVYCWYTGEDYFTTPLPTTARDGSTEPYVLLMQNQHVTYSGGQWTYAPSKYWPLNANEKLTFRAYAPYVSYLLQMDDYGMPMLPVVVTKDDYHNGKQHDPLWGTGRLVDPSTLEYYPEPDPEDADQSKSKRYGQHYNNITYEMSGDYRLANSSETRNGVIDWYFHHGMAKLMFAISVIQDPGCDKVTIRSIQIENLYTQGLLSLSSATTSASDKPSWTQEGGNMEVTLSEATRNTDAGDLAPAPEPDPMPVDYKPYPFVIKTSTTAATPYYNLLSTGLLVIPRDFRSDELTVTITYSIDDDEDEKLTATGTIKQNIVGNTAYTLNLSLTPSTRGLEITMVQSAFTGWTDGGTMERWVYNW